LKEDGGRSENIKLTKRKEKDKKREGKKDTRFAKVVLVWVVTVEDQVRQK